MTAQLHTCTDAPRAGTSDATTIAAEKRGSVRCVDFHCHVTTPALEQLVKDFPQKQVELEQQRLSVGEQSIAHNAAMMAHLLPKLTRADERLRDMDAMGVDIQVLSPSPTQYYYWAERDLAATLVRLQNESIAQMCATAPDRFVGLGNVSLQFPDLAVEQLRFCMQHLGFKGVEISATVNGREIADREFWPFWRCAQELGAVVFLHPFGTSLGARASRYYLSNLVGIPLETTIALSHLIFGGVLDRYPGVRICAAHGGGFLASYAGRSDRGWQVRPECRLIKQAPSEYLKQIFFDTVVFSGEELRHLVTTVGAGQLVVGTDYPFDMGNHQPLQLLAMADLTAEQRAEILSGTAARLLGVLPGGRCAPA